MTGRAVDLNHEISDGMVTHPGIPGPMMSIDALPPDGWRFFAVPPRIRGIVTFPVRAFALVT